MEIKRALIVKSRSVARRCAESTAADVVVVAAADVDSLRGLALRQVFAMPPGIIDDTALSDVVGPTLLDTGGSFAQGHHLPPTYRANALAVAAFELKAARESYAECSNARRLAEDALAAADKRLRDARAALEEVAASGEP